MTGCWPPVLTGSGPRFSLTAMRMTSDPHGASGQTVGVALLLNAAKHGSWTNDLTPKQRRPSSRGEFVALEKQFPTSRAMVALTRTCPGNAENGSYSRTSVA